MALRSPRGTSQDSSATKKAPDATRRKRLARVAERDERQATRRRPVDSGRGDNQGLPGDTTTTEPLFGSDMQTPRSSFGQQFKPASFPDLYTNPEVLASAWMGGKGIDPQTSGGMHKVYQDLAQVMPQLFQLTQGGGGFDQAGFASFIDFANQFLNQYSTPGGGVISPSAVGNIFSAGDNSALGMMLNNPSLDPSQQANLLLGLVGGGLATSVPGALASAAMGNAEAMAGDWMAQQAQARPGRETSFTDFLRQNGFDQLFR